VGASVEAESKRCSRCRRVLDPGCFAFKCRDRGILQSRCRECMAELLHLHYLRRSASYKARAAVNNKRITAQNRQRVREVLRDARCADCRLGDLAVLEFDHREPGEKRDDISSLVRQHCSWSVISREIAKCDVVCANCHRKRTARYFGWRRLVGLEELALPQLPDRYMSGSRALAAGGPGAIATERMCTRTCTIIRANFAAKTILWSLNSITLVPSLARSRQSRGTAAGRICSQKSRNAASCARTATGARPPSRQAGRLEQFSPHFPTETPTETSWQAASLRGPGWSG
jgi:hypothetical protein